jgi:cell division protein FtsW
VRTQTKNFHWNGLVNPASLILFCVAALTILGVTILFSASVSFRQDPYFFLKRQIIWIGIALAVGLIVSRINLKWVRPMSWWIAGLLLIGLVIVLIPGIGVYVNGSRRWLDFGLMRFQVSEIAKVAMILSLAHYLGANQKLIPTFWRGFVLPCAWIALFCGLIIVEPDYGTAMLCGAIGFSMLLLAGVRLIYLIPSLLGGIGFLAVAIFYNPVRLARITSFLDIEGNRSDGAYQLWQAILAFGAGGVDGVGLGNGRQQMAFLPEAHTDFIFAIAGEELGLFFTLGTVLLFMVIFVAGIFHLRKAPNLFQYLLIAGCLLLLTLQALINLGVVTGCLPTKGMSLPFISYGGSNLILMAIVIGLIANTHILWRSPALKSGDRAMKDIE